MVLKMPLTAKTPKDSTQIIYSLVGTLTELDPNITEISSPIEQSNAFIKEVTSEIEQLNTKNKLIKLGNLALLEQKLPDLKEYWSIYRSVNIWENWCRISLKISIMLFSRL